MGRESFIVFSLIWNCVPFGILYVLYNGKGINKEGSLTDILVDRRHNEELEREMNHNDSSTGNIFHWSLITHLML